MTKKLYNTKLEADTISVECSCNTHGFRITSSIEQDWEEAVFLTFWVDEWYKDDGILSNIWQRIKLAWKVLANGDYFLHEIILERDQAKQVGDSLTIMANNLPIRGNAD